MDKLSDFIKNPTAENLERLRREDLVKLAKEYNIRGIGRDKKGDLQKKICQHLIKEDWLTREDVAAVFPDQMNEQLEEEATEPGASFVAGDQGGADSPVAGDRRKADSPVAGDLAGADSPVAGDQGRAASPVAGGRRKAAANNQTIKQHKEEAKEPGINVVFKVNITAPVAGDQGGAAAPVAGDRGGAAALMAGDRGGAASPVAGDRGGAAATNPAIKQFKEVKEPGINVVFEVNITAPGGRATAAALADSFANMSVSNDDSD